MKRIEFYKGIVWFLCHSTAFKKDLLGLISEESKDIKSFAMSCENPQDKD